MTTPPTESPERSERAPGLGGAFHRLWTAGTVTHLGDGMPATALPLIAAPLTQDPWPSRVWWRRGFFLYVQQVLGVALALYGVFMSAVAVVFRRAIAECARLCDLSTGARTSH